VGTDESNEKAGKKRENVGKNLEIFPPTRKIENIIVFGALGIP
jgi:hypothetical protein